MTATIGVNEYRFKEYRVIVSSRQVLKGGEVVALTPKAVQLLIALIERRDRVVTKDELLEIGWPTVTVEEGNVAWQISLIRRILGRDVVNTVARLGYRFVGTLETADPAPPARTNLPVGPQRLIGREADLEQLSPLLLEHGLVVVVGAPGVGKTSLVQAAARLASDRMDGGVWYLDVSKLSDVTQISAGFCRLLGIGLSSQTDPITSLGEGIGRRRALFVLDGCEQALSAARDFGEGIVAGYPQLTVLAASRTPLRAAAERVLRLDPLDTTGPASTAAEAMRIPAVAMFLDRAEAADARFGLHDRDAPQVAELCRTLNGLPLALQIVGARAPALGVRLLSERVAEFALKASGPLRGAFDLSWSILQPRERKSLMRLSVLGGSWDVDAAAAVAGSDIPREEFLDSLGELVDQSLVMAEGDENRRFRLLDTTRTYALARFSRQTERRRHQLLAVKYYAAKMTAADQAWDVRPEPIWRDELSPDLDGLRIAMGWALSSEGDAEPGVVLAGRCAQLWSALSLQVEGRRWLETALAKAAAAPVPRAVEAALWRGLGSMLMFIEPQQAVQAFDRAATLYGAEGDSFGEGRALAGRGVMEAFAHELEKAEASLLRAKVLLGQSSRAKSYASCLSNLAFVYVTTGRSRLAATALEEALEAMRRTGDGASVGQIEMNLGEIAFFAGDLHTAVARAQAAVDKYREAGSDRFLPWGLLNLATYLEDGGNHANARLVASEALPLARGRRDEVLVNLIELIALLFAESDPEQAARLAGWANGTPVRRSRPRQLTDSSVYRKLMDRLKPPLHPKRLELLMDESEWLPQEKAIDISLELLRTDERRRAPQRRVVPLVSVGSQRLAEAAEPHLEKAGIEG